MGKTSIEWTDASWNPIVGCTEISPGCANCYAARLAATRLKNTPAYSGLAILPNGAEAARESGVPRWTGEVRFLPERLEEPLHWKKPCRIFVCDMGDLFHESVTDDQIGGIFRVMLLAKHHTFQVLTKRAERMRRWFKDWYADQLPSKNVWLGVSVENQHFADERIPLLLSTPAAVRWISAEPLLGPVDLRFLQPNGEVEIDSLKGTHGVYRPHRGENQKLDWVVCGGESGPNARPMHPDWARSLRDQCQAAGVPFFFKQWGETVPCDQITTEELIGDARHGRKQPTRTCGYFCCREHQHIEHGELLMLRVGKGRAGRLLDGREWNEFPNVSTLR